MARTTLPALRGSRTSPAVETSATPFWLSPKAPVPISQEITCARLANELEVSLDRILPLIEHRYLRVVQLSDDPGSVLVARPTGAALSWLRIMFMPIAMRPYLPIEDVAQMFETYPANIRYLCVNNNIPIYADPVFGELLTVRGYRDLRRSLFEAEMLPRFDRGVLLNLLGRLRDFEQSGNRPPLPYSARVEREIARIAALPESDRGSAAKELYTAYLDAKKVADALNVYFENRRKGGSRYIGGKMQKLLKISARKRGASASAS